MFTNIINQSATRLHIVLTYRQYEIIYQYPSVPLISKETIRFRKLKVKKYLPATAKCLTKNAIRLGFFRFANSIIRIIFKMMIPKASIKAIHFVISEMACNVSI